MANNQPNKEQKKHYGFRELFIAVIAIGLIITIIIKFSGGSLIKHKQHDLSEAPEIEFEMPDGKSTSIQKLRGRVVLLNFWASWCGPCIEEMPSLRMLEQHYKNKGFIVLAFNISESKEQIRGRLGGSEMPDN